MRHGSLAPHIDHGPPEAADMVLTESFDEPADLRLAIEAHAIVAITDSRGRITHVNDEFCRISGYSREELIGKDHRIINSGRHPEEFFRDLWETIRAGRVWRGDIQNVAKNGSPYWVAATIAPSSSEGEGSEQPRYVAIGTDITEHKRMESALHANLRIHELLAELSTRFIALPSDRLDAAIEQTLQRIVETVGVDRVTLWQLDDTGQHIRLTHYWHPPDRARLPSPVHLNDLFPWGGARIIRGEVIRFSQLDDLPPEAERDAETFRTHGTKSNVTIPLIADGKVFGLLSFACLHHVRRWSDDDVDGMKLISQIIGNVIARQRADSAASQLKKEIAHSSRVATLGEVASALAHELNQPLTAILSNAQAARRYLSTDNFNLGEIQAALEDIIRDDKRAGTVIHNLRAMLDKQPFDRERCCINDLLSEVLQLLHSELLAGQAEIRTSLTPDVPDIEVVHVELQQVLVNVLLNAVQAMKQRPHDRRLIEIETGTTPGAVAISFRDHGCGIPPERLSEIFNPFYTTKQNGLGMGLAICRRIVENHAGSIDACNHPEGGAVFVISLPASA